MLQLLEPKQNFFGEEVVAVIDTILSLVWDVLSKVLGSYIYDRFFKARK